MKENKVYLSHILDCISHIQAYTEGMDEELFNKNFMVQDAVVRNFQNNLVRRQNELPQNLKCHTQTFPGRK